MIFKEYNQFINTTVYVYLIGEANELIYTTLFC